MKIVKISAMWCSSCIIMKSKFNETLSDKDIEVIDLDYDLDNIEEYNVTEVLPVFIKYEKNKEVSRLVGEHTKEELIEFIGEV